MQDARGRLSTLDLVQHMLATCSVALVRVMMGHSNGKHQQLKVLNSYPDH